MKAISEKIIVAEFGLAILLLFSVSIASYFSIQKLVKNKQWVIHTYKVIEAIDNAFGAISEAENARRGYLITRQKVDLDTYLTNVQKVTQSIEQTRQLTADNPIQRQRLDLLEPLIEQRLALLNRSVDLLQQEQLEMSTQIALTEQGRAIHQEIKSRLQTLKTEEYAFCKSERQRQKSAFATLF